MEQKTRTIKFENVFLILCISYALILLSVRFILYPQTFLMEQEVVRIPLIIENGRYFTYVEVESDTIRMIIDTGTSRSLLSDELTMRTFRKQIATSGGRFRQLVPIRRVNKMEWGDLRIENLLVVGGTGINIIGDDILRHFYVQFDNENQEIALTRNSSLIEKRGIRVPFSRGGNANQVIISLSLNDKEGDFLLDTGYGGELRVDSDFFYSSELSDLKNVRWRGYLGGALFMPESLRGEGMSYMTIARHELGGMVFDNAIVTRNIHWYVNVIGTVFLQRFRTFTIDYLNGYIYFELPEGNSFVSFSDNPIDAVPVAYLELLYNRINSFGIEVTRRYPYPIRSLRKNSMFAEKGIRINDRLIGINQLIFNETAFNQLGAARHTFRLETNRSRQRTVLDDVFFRRDNATFHFFRNAELISIEKMRSNILYPVPAFAYSFDSTPSPFALHTISVKPNFYLHILPSTLVGEKKYFTIYRDGEEQIVSNNPDASF